MIEDVNKILDYIEKHLYETIRLDDIIEIVNYSKSHISRIFNKCVGISMPNYITKRRLSNAALMIYNSEKTIGYIADTHGFSSEQYFSTLFKKELGISPLNYRKRNGYIYLFPKRIIKGGKAEIMEKLENVVYQIHVQSDSDKEVKVELLNVEYTDESIELTVATNQESSTETTVKIDIEQ